MTRRRSLALLPALAALGAAASCGHQPPPAAPPAAASRPVDVVSLDAAAMSQAGIAIAAAGTVTRAEAIEAPGLVSLNETKTARIGSLVDGSVLAVFVQPGARVRARQALAEMHGHIVHDSWADYRKAKADERRIANELRFATEAEARAGRLYADKAVALQDLQRAQANRVSAQEALDIARTEVRRAEEALEHLGITNQEDPTGESGETIPVRAPIAGVVLERLVTQGMAVTPGTTMFVVSDLSGLWVLAEVDEEHLSRIRVGRHVAVRVAAYPAESFPGTVSYVGETVNPKTRRVTVRCEVPNGDGRLKPEMYATVTIGESDPREVLAVPRSAIQAVNGRTHVFVAEADGRFRLRPVEIGSEQDALVEIRGGLTSGERVVVSGAFVLKAELLKAAAAVE
jgi:multidrug efflux pump subunit AcrA (membrane-fusion protein)